MRLFHVLAIFPARGAEIPEATREAPRYLPRTESVGRPPSIRTGWAKPLHAVARGGRIVRPRKPGWRAGPDDRRGSTDRPSPGHRPAPRPECRLHIPPA